MPCDTYIDEILDEILDKDDTIIIPILVSKEEEDV